MQHHIKRIIKHFELRTRYFHSLHPSARVLDVGCGNGRKGFDLKAIHPDIELHGVDVLPRDQVPDIYSYSLVDLEQGKLPFPDDYFDSIVFSHVIEHLRSPEVMGKEFKRVLKARGKIFIETPNWTTIFVPSFGFHREQQGPFNFYDDPSHFKPWTKHALYVFLAESCQLRVEKVGTLRNWFRVPFDFIIILIGLLTGSRAYVLSSFWNLYGWCIFGLGVKE